MEDACHLILAWLDREFPNPTYPSQHWSADDASRYLSPGVDVLPPHAHEAVEVFAKRTAPPPSPCKELVVSYHVLKAFRPSLILAALRSQGVVRRLRKAPAERLLLDRDLILRPWGHSCTGDEEGIMDPRD